MIRSSLLRGITQRTTPAQCVRIGEIGRAPQRLAHCSFRQPPPKAAAYLSRPFSSSTRLRVKQYELQDNSYAKPAHRLNQDVSQEENKHFEERLSQEKGKQIRTPWHREGADKPSVDKIQSQEVLTKGR